MLTSAQIELVSFTATLAATLWAIYMALWTIIEPKDGRVVQGWQHWLFIRSTTVLSIAALAQVFTVLAALWTEQTWLVGLAVGEFCGYIAVVVVLFVQVIRPEERSFVVHALPKLRLGAMKRIYFGELRKRGFDVANESKSLAVELSKLDGWKARRDAMRTKIERLFESKD